MEALLPEVSLEQDDAEWLKSKLRPFIPAVHPIMVTSHPDRDLWEILVGEEVSPEAVYGTAPKREIRSMRESNAEEMCREYFKEMSRGFEVPIK